MRRKYLFLLVVLSALGACADAPTESSSIVDSSPTVRPTTVHQAVVDLDAPNWFAAGGPGMVELAGGTDGEPDVLSGRFVLDGTPISDAASGDDLWVVVGEGTLQQLDQDAQRRNPVRPALSGEQIRFIHTIENGFFIGGDGGQIQLLDRQGEPTTTTATVFEGAAVTAAASNSINWLLGSDDGRIQTVRAQTLTSIGVASSVFEGRAVQSIVSDGSGWIAFSQNSYVVVSATGTPGTEVPLDGVTVTAADFVAGKIVIGTADGRVGIADPPVAGQLDITFVDVLEGHAVRRFKPGNGEFVVVGDAGYARRLDATLAPIGAATQLSRERDIVSAHWTGTRWALVLGAIGFVKFVGPELEELQTRSPVLDGAEIHDASAGAPGVLIVGAQGKFQLLDELGATVTPPASVGGGQDLFATAWNGRSWLIAGADGFAQRVDENGDLTGDPQTLLDGETIRFAAWSGEFWLIGGDGGKVQLVRADGTASGGTRTVPDAAVLHDGRFGGVEWFVVGESSDGVGLYARVTSDETQTLESQRLGQIEGALYAVDFNGLEWLMAGAGGLAQRVSAEGAVEGQPIQILPGLTVYDLYFNGTTYVAAGDLGALVGLGANYAPLRTPIALLDRHPIKSVEWTLPRGFASGPCLTNTACFQGPCVGGLDEGQCCDSACDKPCMSCFESHTGQADGTCAPITAGRMPLPDASGNRACERQSEGTCGYTGVCDGQGECAYYGAEVACGTAICSRGRFTPAAFCTGEGQCEEPERQDCSPYAACTEDGCAESCASDEDCVSGFVCEEERCVEAPEEEEPEVPDPPSEEDEGCCATVAPRRPPMLPLFVGVLVLGLWRRRERAKEIAPVVGM